MTASDPQVTWTEEQWARVNQVIQEEASRTRVAATFLPLYGPLPPDIDFIRAEKIEDADPPIKIADRAVIQLATLQVPVLLRAAQMADPEMRSALALFRRAANVLGRLEDAIVFDGQPDQDKGPPYGAPPRGPHPGVWAVHGGQRSSGLWLGADEKVYLPVPLDPQRDVVKAVSEAIGKLESKGYFGPFAVVLDQQYFLAAQTPSQSLVLPQDRIIPFLGGGSLLRSSTLPNYSGVVVALGGSPVELVVARDVSCQFLQVTSHPQFYFRVYEKMALRIKARQAIVRLEPDDTPRVLSVSPHSGPVAGGTEVEIWGTNFTNQTQIYFGRELGKNPQHLSDTKMIVSSPQHPAGKVSVKALPDRKDPDPKDGPPFETAQFEYIDKDHAP
jgi:uncharacterized linocin/CFP29 family protein